MPEVFKAGNIDGVDIRDSLISIQRSVVGCQSFFVMTNSKKSSFPVMSYISSTDPGITRGPHEHVDQADLFCFLARQLLSCGCGTIASLGNLQLRPILSLLVRIIRIRCCSPGVVHAYQNVGETEGIVINCPNRLYMGDSKGRKNDDEIRHEDDPETIYRVDD